MAKGQSRGNREAKKPKATKVKAAAAPGPSAQGTARDGFEGPAVKDDPVNLDEHRGMAAQRDTEIRRDIREVQVDQAALRDRQEELEDRLLAAPAATRADAAASAPKPPWNQNRASIAAFPSAAEGARRAGCRATTIHPAWLPPILRSSVQISEASSVPLRIVPACPGR